MRASIWRLIVLAVVLLLAAAACTTSPPPTNSARTATGSATVPHSAKPATISTGSSVEVSPSALRDPSAATGPVDTADLGGARVVLPPGWVALNVAAYSKPGSGSEFQWCLSPRGIAASQVSNHCSVYLARVVSSDSAALMPEVAGGFNGNPPQPCGGSHQYLSTHETTGDRIFGGRVADYRRWDFTCRTVHYPSWEQYVVATVPAFVLYSPMADQATAHDGMTLIAEHSALPIQTSPLRLFDRGYVRAITRARSLDIVVIDRTAGDPPVNNNPATYRYELPDDLLSHAAFHIGELIDIRTDGHHVTATGHPYTV